MHKGSRYAAQNPTVFSRYVEAIKERLAILVNLENPSFSLGIS